jgi:hypothetical protein
MPMLLEEIWARAEPGREAASLNEALRSLNQLLEVRPPPPRFVLACRIA